MKRTEQVGLVEVSSDGTTVWVNDSGGRNVGRFSVGGIDFGASSRLKAKTGQMTMKDWTGFQFDMLDVHGVRITDKHMPDFLKVSV